MWEKIREHELCSKLCGLHKTSGACYEHQAGTCKGACLTLEESKLYNQRVTNAIASIAENNESIAVIGRGRNSDERSLVLVEKGNFAGFGFLDKSAAVASLEEAKMYVKPAKENRMAQNIINSFLVNPTSGEVIVFEK
jgi:DNA polymerase-3 subunit epsilon